MVKYPSAERKAALIKLAKLMKRNSRQLAVMESLDSGKLSQIDAPLIFQKPLTPLLARLKPLIKSMMMQHLPALCDGNDCA